MSTNKTLQRNSSYTMFFDKAGGLGESFPGFLPGQNLAHGVFECCAMASLVWGTSKSGPSFNEKGLKMDMGHDPLQKWSKNVLLDHKLFPGGYNSHP